MMWETKITAGCVAMGALWIVGVLMIIGGGVYDVAAAGQLGLALICGGLALALIRDNQRTRRMLQRPGEHVGPMRRVSEVKDWR